MLSVLLEIVDNGANDLLTLCPSWTMDAVEELKGNSYAARIKSGCHESKANLFFFDVCGDVGNRISMRRMQARIHVGKAGGQLTK